MHCILAYRLDSIAELFKNHTIIAELRRMLRTALPLIAAQLLQVGNGFVDTVVAGRLGKAELAAGGIGASIWFFCSLLCLGMMAGLSPILSEMIGARRRNAVGQVFRQGLWLGVIAGAIACALVLLIVHILPNTALQPELIPLVRQYLIVACWSLPAFAVVLAARGVCEASHLTKPVLLVQLLGLVINTIINLTLGLGLFGFPKLGLYGIGLATSLVMITMSLVLLWLLLSPKFIRYNLFASFDWPDWAQIKPIVVLAVPIFFAIAFESGLFVATAWQAGVLGTLEASVHFIAIGAAAFCFMLPLGLSFALTARVGRVYGRGELSALKLRVLCGLLLTFAMAATTALLLMIFRHPITVIYTNDEEVRAIAAKLLIMAAVFQLSDGLQATLLGMLRGLQDTRVPMLINGFSYWAVAFGLGYTAAHFFGFGIYGLWSGLVIGLTVAASGLGWRLHNRIRVLSQPDT